MRDAGYRTTLIGKWHLGYLPRYSPLKNGYDEFFGIMGGYAGYYTRLGDGGEHDLYEGETPVERQGYVTDMLSELAVAFVEAAAAAPQPYFLRLHYTLPHWPWSSPSVEAVARQRDVDRAEITEGGSTRIYGEMMRILDAGIGRLITAKIAGSRPVADCSVAISGVAIGERTDQWLLADHLLAGRQRLLQMQRGRSSDVDDVTVGLPAARRNLPWHRRRLQRSGIRHLARARPPAGAGRHVRA